MVDGPEGSVDGVSTEGREGRRRAGWLMDPNHGECRIAEVNHGGHRIHEAGSGKKEKHGNGSDWLGLARLGAEEFGRVREHRARLSSRARLRFIGRGIHGGIHTQK